uniref:Calmodulin-lysine N-methyltransferase n=1 Tax=Anopheles farauti TaxID=69004 RepID=A0A182QD17_9DIPT
MRTVETEGGGGGGGGETPAVDEQRRRRRHEDDINWKMSTEQQVTPDRAVAVDGENNPIKSLRRQRRVDAVGLDPPATTAVTSITGATMPAAGGEGGPRPPAARIEQDGEDDQFAKFNLIEADRVGDEKDENVYVYRLYDRYRLKIRLIGPERPWTASELIGFNNTGNICVWPSEEALAYYVLSRLAQFDGTAVLELGGGMTCLAGLVLAKYGQPAFVHVTDGNELSVENVRKSLVLNKFACTIKSSVLKWEQNETPADDARYHFVLSADCLFFDESRSQLIETIWHRLADEGVALITAPRRGQTLSLFLSECVARGFQYELHQCYNEAIWARHLELKQTEGYDENVHYPLLVKMYKYGHGSVLHRV